MIVLGIETSCDETAAALVTEKREIAANIVLSQLSEHKPYGGIVPEIAARSHLDHIDGLVREAMDRAGRGFPELDGIAVTGGPGLIGGVIVGVMTAKAIAAVLEKPLVNVNHLEAHALTCRLTDDVHFPYLLLLVTGGHCQLLIVEGVGRYVRLGTTIDDAVGEAFDKTAKMLGLGYPGGPLVERAARKGDGARFDLPRPMKGRPGCDFSFSGLKTALRRRIDKLAPGPLKERDVADLCASFEAAVGEVLVDRTAHAIEAYRPRHPACAARSAATRRRGQSAAMARRPAARRSAGRTLVVAGGVAANGYLRKRLNDLAEVQGFRLVAPPPALCTDNAAMVAWAGIERLRLGLTDALDFAPRPRWPLDPNARPALGAGVKA